MTFLECLVLFDARNLLKNDNTDVSLGVLVSMIHRTHMIYLNDQLKNNDLTAGQFPFLIVLYSEEGITQDAMAAHFHMDKGTVARALKKLEDNEYIYREVDKNNRRKYLIYLTKKGKEVVPKITDVDKEWENSICCQFSEEHYNKLFGGLKTLAVNSLEKVDKNGEINKNGSR